LCQNFVPLGEEFFFKRRREREVLPKSFYFTGTGSSSVKMVADRHKHFAHHNNLTSTGDKRVGSIYLDDLELP